MGMASDDIAGVSHVPLESYPVEEQIVPRSLPAITHEISHDGVLKDPAYGQMISAQALDEEELPWIALAKWRKGLVMAGYVPDLDT